MIGDTLPVYALNHVVTRTGLTARQIRHLEQKGFISPARAENTGHRIFSERDIQRLLRIKGYLESGCAREQLSIILSLESDGTES